MLVGPSGCGKSTTLRMLAGLEPVDRGRIDIGDRDVTMLPARERDIAMVFQSYALYPHMTVAENIGFHLKIKKVPKHEIARRVKEAADLLDLGEYLDRKPAKLSGGQRRRVAMGRAIVRQPSVFLMDEPLSNLDAKLRVQTRTRSCRCSAGWGHDRVRHPRSGRGDDDGRPRRGVERRRAPAVRQPS
ncbi:MAG: ATP-binding cassette domain-containing protein [Ilumatobacteraceae bacterium]